jgi:molybdenum cofactor biosynthesis enzyme
MTGSTGREVTAFNAISTAADTCFPYLKKRQSDGIIIAGIDAE